jgi:hypothetical protein
MRLTVLLSILLCLLSCSSKPEEVKEPPSHKYNYYSGSSEFGNHYCKVQKFIHGESGKTVTLIGMIHTADASFYTSVDNEIDKSDIVLTEGIYGLPSFGAHKYFSLYTFSIIERFTYLQGLMPQGQSLKDRDNTVSADMSSDDFAAQGRFYTPLLQLVSLPVMLAVTEPYYIYKKSLITFSSIFSDKWAKHEQADIRHTTLTNLDSTDTPASTLMPGIIGSRNKVVLKTLEKSFKKEEISSAAIPWGASHMPGLERDLLANGYLKKEGRWLRSIAVKDYVESAEYFPENSSSWGIPYLYNFQVSRHSYQNSMLFSLIKSYHSSDYKRFTLVYGDLFDSISFKKGNYFSLLPRIYSKPILFDYASKDDKARCRFLWFFEFGSLE